MEHAFLIYRNVLTLEIIEDWSIQGNEREWFQNHLENRQQMVKVNNDMSSMLPLNIGVPHGSVLGP